MTEADARLAVELCEAIAELPKVRKVSPKMGQAILDAAERIIRDEMKRLDVKSS
jgi:hypothetical protein